MPKKNKDKLKILAFIFARGGSKEIKNKNIKLINNKPLIYYSIKIAKSIKIIDDVYVSSDSSKILNISKKFGAKTIKRPLSISNDTSSEIDAWKHAINFLKNKNIHFDLFVSLPTTSPLRNKSDIINLINKLDHTTDFIVTTYKSNKLPWFNMVTKDSNGYLSLLSKPKNKIFNRQEANQVFNMSTVAYVTKPDTVLNTKNIFDKKIKSIDIPVERALDIDSQYDLKIAKLLLKN